MTEHADDLTYERADELKALALESGQESLARLVFSQMVETMDARRGLLRDLDALIQRAELVRGNVERHPRAALSSLGEIQGLANHVDAAVGAFHASLAALKRIEAAVGGGQG